MKLLELTLELTNTQEDRIKTQHIIARSEMLKKVRSFFDKRKFFEIDSPCLQSYPPIDAFIDPIATDSRHFLHTSPEYALKKILASFHQHIYFLGHVFRKEEDSPLHREEFTMIEWYKINTSEKEFLDEVCELLYLFLPTKEYTLSSYHDLIQRDLKHTPPDSKSWTEQEKRHYQFTTQIEPHLGNGKIDVITNFFPEDALLSQILTENGREVAKRYEFFYDGIEIGNGFLELRDPEQQQLRFEEINQLRKDSNKTDLPIDPEFIKSIAKIPDNTFGIACGFDRLFMLNQKISHIQSATH